MFEIYLDKINLKESKQKKRLVFISHDWSDDLNIPILILIFPNIWFSMMLYERTESGNTEISFHTTITASL